MMRANTKNIERLKDGKNAVILAHNYQRPEIQDIADFVGDSLELSQKAIKTDADMIIFCGVDFMAETASILNPGKKVLIPDLGAICPMAQQLETEELLDAKRKYPDAEVVLYINTLAEDKAHADCICTSANAAQIVDLMDSDLILFGPDSNLAHYVRHRTSKEIISIPEYGLCPTHHQITVADLMDAREKHPEAKLVVHPECIPEIQESADHIASTSGIFRYCRASAEKEFLIGTEVGMLHRLEKEIPEKRFYPLSIYAVCPHMKMHTLEKVERALETGEPEITVRKGVADKARKAIERMLELSS